MGKVYDSIISGTKGRIGRVVVSNVNGQEIIKMRPKKSSKKPTEKQNLIKDRFSKAIFFMQSYKEFAKKFYGTKIGMKSSYNQASGSVLKAMVCDMINLDITTNYDQIQISKGRGLPPNPIALTTTPGKLTVEWINNEESSDASNDLLVLLIAVDGDLSTETQFLTNLTTRDEEQIQISLIPKFQRKKIHVWMAFIQNEGLFASNSSYVGNIVTT